MPDTHADLRQRCADRLLAKDAESWGYGTFEGDREAALAVADEVLAVRDDELAQLREHVEDLNDLIRQERVIHEETIRRAEQAEADVATLRSLAMNVLDDLEHGRVHHARRTLREALHTPAAGGEDA